jgi:universal stress protein A
MKVKTSGRSKRVVLELEPREAALPAVAVPELDIKRVLAPVDFSESSRKAFHYAYHFARQFQAELMLLHIIVSDSDPAKKRSAKEDKAYAAFHEATARRLSEWRNEITSEVSVKAVIREGTSAPQAIIEAGRDSNSDLIVIGNHGRSGLAAVFIGSTAERVVRHAPCPVLVIRERGKDFIVGENPRPGRQRKKT